MEVIKNWGKMVPTVIDVPPVTIPNIIEGQPDIVITPARKATVQGDGVDTTWFEMTEGIPILDNQWFIAVQDDDGFISCCERDPNMVSLFGYDILQIETDLSRDQIFCKIWNGTDVVEPPLGTP